MNRIAELADEMDRLSTALAVAARTMPRNLQSITYQLSDAALDLAGAAHAYMEAEALFSKYVVDPGGDDGGGAAASPTAPTPPLPEALAA